jgi:ABC-type branched-subunit amino acid transport system ATPase component
MNTVYDVLTALDKIGSITDIELEREGGIDISEQQKTEGVHLKISNLTYTFSDAAQPVISNLNMEVMPGERICIGGANGTGKTLLMKLITGYYSGYTGSITVDGLPVENIDLTGLRDIIGENFSDQGVFKGSILENITCGRKHISIEDVLEATRMVNLHEYITQLPKGYETPVDPEGKMLSGGTLRKMILARCLLGRPRLILMEDNLQAILPDERMEILKSMMDAHRKSTIIFISNNPAIQAITGRTIHLKQN